MSWKLAAFERADWSRASWRQEWPAAALVVAALILIAPLWCVTMPAMPDYPAHLATFYLIGGGTGDPALARFYRIRWIFAPNLASEVIVPWLALLTGLAAAIKLFLSAAIAFWVLGAGAIQRALFGRIGVAPLLGALFAYNANFAWGFFNYYFAAGLGLCVFAAWIASTNKAGVARSLSFAVAVTIVYFCHIFAAASLAVMIVCFEMARTLEAGAGIRPLLRRVSAAALPFLPAGLAFMLLRPTGLNGKLEFNLLDTLLDRYESLILYHFDAPSYALPAALFALLIFLGFRRRARLALSMAGVLAVLLLGSLLAPEWAMGGWAVHLRLPALFCITLFAVTDIRLPPSWTRGIAAAALAVIGVCAVTLALNWRDYDRQYAEFHTAMADIPKGSRLLTVLDGNAMGLDSDQPYWHMAELAIPERDAMTALLFTTKGQHIVQLRQPYAAYAAATAQQGSPPDIGELEDLAEGQMKNDIEIRQTFPYLLYFQCHYDEVVVIHRGGARQPIPDMLALRHAGSFFSLYDIRPDPPLCGGKSVRR